MIRRYNLWEIHPPDESGSTKIRYMLKPHMEHKFNSEQLAITFIDGFYEGYYQKIKDHESDISPNKRSVSDSIYNGTDKTPKTDKG